MPLVKIVKTDPSGVRVELIHPCEHIRVENYDDRIVLKLMPGKTFMLFNEGDSAYVMNERDGTTVDSYRWPRKDKDGSSGEGEVDTYVKRVGEGSELVGESAEDESTGSVVVGAEVAVEDGYIPGCVDNR